MDVRKVVYTSKFWIESKKRKQKKNTVATCNTAVHYVYYLCLLCACFQGHQQKYLAECAEMVKRASPNLQISLVTQMRSIGINCPEILKEHRKLFEELREQTALRDYAQAALDVIEGRRYSAIGLSYKFSVILFVRHMYIIIIIIITNHKFNLP